MGKVLRRQVIEGVTIPSLICNGGYCSWSNTAVYKDGTVDCEYESAVTLDGVAELIQEGWLLPRMRKGQKFHIYELGTLHIAKAEWQFNKKSYLAYIEQTMRSLNAEPETQKFIEMQKPIEMTGFPIPFKEGKLYEGERLEGTAAHIFYQGEELFLTTINAFSDGTLQIDAAGDRYFQPEEIEELFAEGVLTTRPKEGQWVRLGVLGRVQAGDTKSFLEPADKAELIRHMALTAAGKVDPVDEAFWEAYRAYNFEPSDQNKEALRRAVEAVPAIRSYWLLPDEVFDILYPPKQV